MSVWHGQCYARPMVTLPAAGITAHWLVQNYTAWCQKHKCVNNLLRVVLDSGAAGIRTCDLLTANPD